MFKRVLTGAALLAFLVASASPGNSATSRSGSFRYLPAKSAVAGPAGKLIPVTGFVAGILAHHTLATSKASVNSKVRTRPLGQPFGAVTHIVGPFPANEPSLAVDPVVSAHMFGSSNDYRLGGDAAAGLYRTFSGTSGWSDDLVQYVNSFIYYYNASGDPAVGSDVPGNEFTGMLAFNRFATSFGQPQNSVLVARTHFSIDDQFVDFYPANIDTEAFGNFNDKDSFATDNGASGKFVNGDYVAWTKFAFSEGIFFLESPILMSNSHSFGGVFGWSSPVLVSQPGGTRLCPVGFSTPAGSCLDNQGSSIAIGKNGIVWVAYENFDTGTVQNQILIAKSTNGGASFRPPVLVASDFDIADTVGAFRVNSFPNLAVNRTTGRLYVTWADQRAGFTQILASTSFTGVAGTWSAPVVINTDGGTNFHFMPAISVNPGSGRVYISFYSNEKHVGSNLYDYVYRNLNSLLGGTFIDAPLNPATIDPSFGGFGGTFFGDYTAGSPNQAAGAGACMAWTDDNSTVGEEFINNRCVP